MFELKNLLFSPSVALMNQLSYRKKFLLLGLLILIAISAVTFSLYSSLNKVISTSERELEGLTAIEPITDLIQLIQKHRGLSRGFLGGNTGMLKEIAEQSKAISNTLELAENILPRNSPTSKGWKKIKSGWERITNTGLELSTEQNFADHTDLIQQLQIYIISVADQYFLSLDPEIDSYYLIDTFLYKLPDVLEHLGQLRAIGTGVLAKKHATENEKTQLNILNTEINNTLSWLRVNLSKTGTYNPATQNAIELISNGISDSTQQLFYLLQKDILAGHYDTHSHDFFDLTSKIIDNGYEQMHGSLLLEAKRLINARLNKARAKLYIGIGIALFCLLTVAYFMAGIYLSIIRSINSLGASARAFAKGNILERAHLVTDDELKLISNSFNEMADGLSELLLKYSEANELKQKVIASSLVGIVAYHADSGQCVLCNKAAAEIIGTTEKLLLQQNFRQIASWKENGLLRTAEEALGSGEDKCLEAQALSAFGKELWLNALLAPFISNGEQHLLVMFEDISERKKTETMIKYMVTGTSEVIGEKFFDTFVECMAKAADCHFALVANMGTEDLYTARTISVWAGVNHAENFSFDVRSTPCENVVSNIIKHDVCIYMENVANQFPHDVWLKDNAVESYAGIPLFKKDGGYLGHMAIMDDKPFTNPRLIVSILKVFASRASGELERWEIESMLRKATDIADAANKAKGDFLATMSHEIRTPMNAIIGLSQLCLQTDLTTKQLDYLRKIHGASKSLLGIINDILDLSKIESGKLELEDTPFYLDSIMENLATISCVRAQEKGLECSLEALSDVPNQLIGDPLRLSQVLINLTGNAVKFTEKGEIAILIEAEEVAEDHATLRFSVQDTGIGLTQEQIKKLFQSFTQVDSSTSRKFGGTGLGLSISKRLVELMGGKIYVESAPFVGSKFIFTAQFRKPAQQPENKYILNAGLQGMRVLLVDDCATSRKVIETLLRSFTCDVTAVDNAASALDILQENNMQGITPYRLVITDWKMPKIDGLELAQKLRKEISIGSIPKILLLGTYCADNTLQLSIENKVVDGILLKPVLKKELFHTIKEIFERTSKEKRSAPTGLFDISLTASISGAHLLLVEDNDINQQIAQELLEKAGVTVTVAENGEEALTCLQEESFDGVLMDTQMPVMDGYTATREIRKKPQYAELPIIAVTANALTSELRNCLNAGMNDCIIKPIDSHKMIATLARWVTPARPVALPAAQPLPLNVEPTPDLPGVNVARGVSRMSGSLTSYYAILEKFCTGQRNAAAAIRKALDAHDWKKAERLAHTLKGLAGTIGAERLQLKLKELQKHIHELGMTQINMLLPAIESDLSSLISAIENALRMRLEENHPAFPKRTGAVPANLAELTELAQKIRSQLEKFDSGVDESIAKMRKAAGDDTALNEILASIQHYIKNYDYEQGLVKLSSLERDLGFSNLTHKRFMK